MATTNLVLGVVISASAIIALASGAAWFSAGVLLAEGAGFFALGRITWVYTVRRQREKASVPWNSTSPRLTGGVTPGCGSG